jgi:hypothetical protein
MARLCKHYTDLASDLACLPRISLIRKIAVMVL